MLNDKEKRVLARYTLIPKLIKASIWMIPGVILLIYLLEFINTKYLYAKSFNSLGFALASIVIIFFIIACFWGRRVIKNAYENATWKDLAHRIEAVFIRSSGEELSLADISKAKNSAKLSSFDQYLHEAFRIFDYYPKTLLKRVMFVVLPCLIIIGSYIPVYIDNYAIMESNRAEAAKVITALSDAFEDCYKINYEDPYEYYDEYGYYFFAYTDSSRDDDIYINIAVDGSIDYVAYEITIDLSIDKEENLVDMQDKLNQLYEMLVSADITIEDKYLTEPTLSDGFIAAFLEDSEYQDISYSQDVIHINFYLSSYSNTAYLSINIY